MPEKHYIFLDKNSGGSIPSSGTRRKPHVGIELSQFCFSLLLRRVFKEVAMAPSGSGYQIVRTWPGPNTGESYYRDEHGQVWITGSDHYQPKTGEEKAEIVGNRLVPNK